MIGTLWGASIFSTCLASPLSTTLTAEHVSDPVKGLCAFLPWLMSGSSQGSAVSSRGGVNTVTRWSPAQWHALQAVARVPYEVLWMKWSECPFISVSYHLYFSYDFFSVKIIVLLSLEWPFQDVLQQLRWWPRHIQAATREADACVTHLWVIQRKIYHILLMIVINNKCEVQIIDSGWHD